jgi:hypothetical protein
MYPSRLISSLIAIMVRLAFATAAFSFMAETTTEIAIAYCSTVTGVTVRRVLQRMTYSGFEVSCFVNSAVPLFTFSLLSVQRLQPARSGSALIRLSIPILPQESPADCALDSNFSIAFNHPRASAMPMPIPRLELAAV